MSERAGQTPELDELIEAVAQAGVDFGADGSADGSFGQLEASAYRLSAAKAALRAYVEQVRQVAAGVLRAQYLPIIARLFDRSERLARIEKTDESWRIHKEILQMDIELERAQTAQESEIDKLAALAAAPPPAAEPRELLCMLCNTEHPIWSADNELWNRTVRRPDGSDEYPFLCPTCFMRLAVARGVTTMFGVRDGYAKPTPEPAHADVSRREGAIDGASEGKAPPANGPPLLPCPFCGGEPIPDRVLRDGCKNSEPDAYAYSIRCRSCAAEGGWAKTPGNANRQWNRRAAPAPTGGDP